MSHMSCKQPLLAFHIIRKVLRTFSIILVPSALPICYIEDLQLTSVEKKQKRTLNRLKEKRQTIFSDIKGHKNF